MECNQQLKLFILSRQLCLSFFFSLQYIYSINPVTWPFFIIFIQTLFCSSSTCWDNCQHYGIDLMTQMVIAEFKEKMVFIESDLKFFQVVPMDLILVDRNRNGWKILDLNNFICYPCKLQTKKTPPTLNFFWLIF